MRGTVYSNRNRRFLFLLLILSLVLFDSSLLKAQVIIKEEIGIKEKEPVFLEDRQSKSKGDVIIQNHSWQWYQHSFKPQKSGELKIALVNAERYLQPIDTMAYFEIKIWSKEGLRDTTIKVKQILGKPIKGSIYWRNEKDWYLYGKGKFHFDVNLWKDATVRLWHEYNMECGWPCGPEYVEYTYKGERTDENLGNFPNIVAASFDWGAQYDFPEGKYLATYRSFFELDVSKFDFPAEYIDSSELMLMAQGDNVDPNGEQGYKWQIQEVAEPWNESTINWDNQPSTAGGKIVLKNPPYQGWLGSYKLYYLRIKEMVKEWINNPASNNGFRVSLTEEEVDETDSWENSIAIPGSDGDWYVGRPELTINFSNPTYDPKSFAINAGSVGRGDTVLIAFKNGDDYRNAYGRQSYTDTINGREHHGMKFTYEDWQSSLDPISGYEPEYMRIFVYVGEKKSEEIMLGETKYYAAVNEDSNDPTSKLIIKEVPVNSSGQPIKPEGLAGGAFSENPIKVLSGGKSGVYWERKWAVINNDGSISSGNLPSGMIRLIGRYWEADKKYKLKLKATAGGRATELEIKVIKPDRLGDKYGKARDVFDRMVDMDSVIIAYAGEYGIPPQWIKGQMRQETPPTIFNFPGGSKRGFPPAYRYEPFTTEFAIRTTRDPDGNSWSKNPFWVTETSMGVDNPPDHQHVRYRPYPSTPMTVWDMVKEYSHLVNESNFSMYGKLLGSGKMDFARYGYRTVQEIYDNILDYFKGLKESPSLNDYELARDSVATYLKKVWDGGIEIPNFQGGLENLIAQTRIASSYGLMQMLYSTAIARGYEISEDKAPEKLNEIEIFFPFAMNFHLDNLNQLLGEQRVGESNWSAGFEKVFMKVFNAWNPGKANYEQNISKYSKDFMPIK